MVLPPKCILILSNFSLTRIITLVSRSLREFPSCFFVLLWPPLATSPYSSHEWFWPELKLDHTVSRRDCENGWSPCLESSSGYGEHLLLCFLGHLYHSLGSLCSSDEGCLFIPWKHKYSSSRLRIFTLDACFAGATLSVVWRTRSVSGVTQLLPALSPCYRCACVLTGPVFVSLQDLTPRPVSWPGSYGSACFPSAFSRRTLSRDIVFFFSAPCAHPVRRHHEAGVR